jgi:hypothetical protein
MTWELSGIEVVAGAVEVHGEQEDRVEPVLLAVGLRLHEEHLLGESVRRVRLLGIAVPEILLAKRHRSELGVRAHGADGDELGDAVQACLLDELRAHHQVVVEEPAGVLAVGPDAAHDRREVDDDVGPRRLEHAHDVRLSAKIVLAAARHEGRRAAAFHEGMDHTCPKEAGTARHDHALARPEPRH